MTGSALGAPALLAPILGIPNRTGENRLLERTYAIVYVSLYTYIPNANSASTNQQSEQVGRYLKYVLTVTSMMRHGRFWWTEASATAVLPFMMKSWKPSRCKWIWPTASSVVNHMIPRDRRHGHRDYRLQIRSNWTWPTTCHTASREACKPSPGAARKW